MHTIKLNVQDNIYDHLMFLLNNLDTKECKIVEDQIVCDDWSHLETEIDKGLSSGTSDKTHEEIMLEIQSKYS